MKTALALFVLAAAGALIWQAAVRTTAPLSIFRGIVIACCSLRAVSEIQNRR